MSFDTSILDEALAQQKTQNEAERQQILAKTLRLLDELGPTYKIERAYVFGSTARPGHFHSHSDVDIAVEQIEPKHFFEAIAKFSAALGRNIDLVELDKCHFAHRIREKGIVWKKTT